MEIKLDILLYFLRSLHPQLIRQPRKDIYFIGTHQFFISEQVYGEEEDAQSDEMHQYLYIATLSELYAYRESVTADMTVLASEDCDLSEEQMNELCCGLILVDGTYGVPYLLNRMINVFSFLASWDKNMHIAALEGRSVQELLDLSREVLEHPVIIFDAGFDVLAYVTSEDSIYTGFQETIAQGYTDPRTMQLIKDSDIFSKLKKGKILIAPAANDTSMTNLYIAFYGDQNVLGYACIFLDRAKVEAGYLDLLRLFVENMTFCLKRDYENQRFGQMMYETFLLNLMNPAGTSAEQISEQVKNIDGLTEYGRFVLGVIDFEGVGGVPLTFVARLLSQEFWDVRPFIYENQICLLRILKENHTALHVMDEHDENRLDSVLVNYQYVFGISNEFSHIMDLQYAYRQATAAIYFGRQKEQKLCRYSEFYYYDLMAKINEYMPVGHLKSVLYRRLRDYDAEHNTKYSQMILTYLECDCNATHAAEQMYLHRNTIRKAVAFVEDMWQISLSDPQIKRDLLISQMIEEYITFKNALPSGKDSFEKG